MEQLTIPLREKKPWTLERAYEFTIQCLREELAKADKKLYNRAGSGKFKKRRIRNNDKSKETIDFRIKGYTLELLESESR